MAETKLSAKPKAKAKPKVKAEVEEPKYAKPWSDAVLVRFLARTARTAPSPSQKSLEHCGTQGYSRRKPDEIFFVDKADADRSTYHKLTPTEIKSMLPQKATAKTI